MCLVYVCQADRINHPFPAGNLHIEDLKLPVFRNHHRLSQLIAAFKGTIISKIITDHLDCIALFHRSIPLLLDTCRQNLLRAKYRILSGLLIEFDNQIDSLTVQKGGDELCRDIKPVIVIILFTDGIHRCRLSVQGQSRPVPFIDQIPFLRIGKDIVKAKVQVTAAIIHKDFQFRGCNLIPHLFVQFKHVLPVLVCQNQ